MGDRLIVGCGYLGARVAALWRGQGLRVLAVTRKPSRAAELAGLGVEPVVADVLDPASLRRLPAVEGVAYCVGMDRSAGASMREVYVGGLRNVLSALPGAPRIVYVSSTGVYGQTGGEEIDESAETAPAEESGRVVLEAEGVLRELRADAVVLRFAGIYGPGRLLRAAALRAGEALAADPEGWLNLIHVEDGAAAVSAADARGRAGAVYNVSDDRPARRREFYATLAALLQAPPPRFTAGPAGQADRRVQNWRLRQELGVALRYPSFAEGLPASLPV
jgi:nucleoside-diphosphate-sugar epimerase